jgi:hypothetical protein
VWGDYACEDLFETDMEGETYNADSPPGNDDWPTIYIYGSCNTCEAYIMDYFSTEHFAEIANYQLQARWYYIAGAISMLVALAAVIKQIVRPSTEKEVELLTSYQGGVIA